MTIREFIKYCDFLTKYKTDLYNIRQGLEIDNALNLSNTGMAEKWGR